MCIGVGKHQDNIVILKTIMQTITNSDLISPCFAWHPYGRLTI